MRDFLLAISILLLLSSPLSAKPLHQRIDEAMAAKVGKVADDAEFLRRVYLDLNGTVPSIRKPEQSLPLRLPTSERS